MIVWKSHSIRLNLNKSPAAMTHSNPLSVEFEPVENQFDGLATRAAAAIMARSDGSSLARFSGPKTNTKPNR
jgi:hypothetical protein